MVTTDEHPTGLAPRQGDLPPLKIRTKPSGEAGAIRECADELLALLPPE